MHRASSFHSRQSFTELKMTSLIDVVFLLLIFFVWTASFQMVEYVLPSQVSEASRTGAAGNTEQPLDAAADFPEIVVRVRWLDRQPSWTVNDEPIPSLKAVEQKLASVFTINREAPVIVHPDQDVPLGHVIDMYDLTRRVGFRTVQFAASQGN